MGLTVTSESSGFSPVPEGTHVARCIRLIDLGTQPGSKQYPTPKRKLLIGWEIPGEREEIDGVDRCRLIFQRYTMSLHENATLRRDLEAWRGRSFTDDELAAFDLRTILDKACMLSVIHQGGYANIKGVSGLPRSVDAPPAEHELLAYEIENGADAVFSKLSDKLQRTIMDSSDWPAGHGHDEPPDGDDGFGDDDIPF